MVDFASRYELLHQLGAGGMGEVFLAKDRHLRRQVAMKFLHAQPGKDEERRRRFLTEARAASALSHPNICVVHDVGETEDGRLYMAMEHVRGEMLNERLARQPLAVAEVVSLALQVADALDAAHGQGVVHRDIKPANICVNERGQAKVLDFGLAKRKEGVEAGESLSQAQTMAGQVLGTPHYMSPEQAMGSSVDARSDLFSLGVVIYELVTGRVPFTGSSLGETLHQITSSAPPAMARFNYALPPELERITLKCLQKAADRRYQSARDLYVDLRNLGQELENRGDEGRGVGDSETLVIPAVSAAPGAPGVAPAIVGTDPVAEPCDALRESDIFVSCALVDDQPMVAGHEGWVSQFRHNLELRLTQLSGDPIKVYTHPSPTGQSASEDPVLELVPEVKTMVSVVSPPFLKSDGCRREVEVFCESAEREGTLWVGQKSRLFKVVKTPVDLDELPPNLDRRFRQLIAHEFFHLDPETGRLREFSDQFGEEARRVFLEKVYDLAYEIHQVLKSYRPKAKVGEGRETESAPTGKSVYLAETTTDLQPVRDQLKRELQERGYQVLPVRPLPLVADQIEKSVCDAVSRAQAVVHLVGARYGLVPEGSDESLAALQVRVSGELCRDQQSLRLIWSPPGLHSTEPRQTRFVRAVRDGELGLERTELVQGTVEQLKTLLLRHLTTPPPPAPSAELDVSADVLRVYLICDRADQEAVEPLEDHLFNLGYEVKVPQFDGDEATFVEIHRENLKLSDAVLIYYGNASGQWVETKLMDLLKSPGYGRTKPWRAQAVYVAPPDNRRKERFRTRSVQLIRQAGAFDANVLDAFIQDLKGARPRMTS